jgi:hypothetical protein
MPVPVPILRHLHIPPLRRWPALGALHPERLRIVQLPRAVRLGDTGPGRVRAPCTGLVPGVGGEELEGAEDLDDKVPEVNAVPDRPEDVPGRLAPLDVVLGGGEGPHHEGREEDHLRRRVRFYCGAREETRHDTYLNTDAQGVQTICNVGGCPVLSRLDLSVAFESTELQ